MVEYEVPGEFDFLEDCFECFHPESGELMLGDIVISKEKVVEQDIPDLNKEETPKTKRKSNNLNITFF